MRILALEGALGRCSVAVVESGTVLAERLLDADRGQAAALAPMVAEVLAASGRVVADFDAIAVCVGPGSFTGLRATIALAQGMAAAAALPLAGVTVAEALANGAATQDREFWVAIDSRRGRVFLDRAGAASAIALPDLPVPGGKIAIGGDAAPVVAAWLAARGFDVMLTSRRQPLARDIAAAAIAALRGERALRPAQPLYIDPPEAKLPAGGLRPAPLP